MFALLHYKCFCFNCSFPAGGENVLPYKPHVVGCFERNLRLQLEAQGLLDPPCTNTNKVFLHNFYSLVILGVGKLTAVSHVRLGSLSVNLENGIIPLVLHLSSPSRVYKGRALTVTLRFA